VSLRRLEVLFEDDELLAVAKPQGMSVHGGAGEKGPTAIDLVREVHPGAQLAHRLDRGTSGVLLVAKDKAALRAITDRWDQAEKRYLAIALGDYRGPELITRPIKDEDGVLRPASTRVKNRARLSIDPPASLLEIAIESGRTHQIRRHLTDAGHPVLFDDRHGDFAANKAVLAKLRSMDLRPPKKGDLLLHAWKLEIVHPRTRERLEIVAPLPQVWRAILDATTTPRAD
jgi:23S rRNA pseudouridine955/2504/2580 synthase